MSELNPLLALFELSRRARQAGNADELAFLLVNETRQVAPYRQSALWLADNRLRALSGLVQPETNAPYAQWLTQVCAWAHQQATDAGTPLAFTAHDLPAALAQDWADWLPPHALWLPLAPRAIAGAADLGGGLLLSGDQPWSTDDHLLLQEWTNVWHHAWLLHAPRTAWNWRRWRTACAHWLMHQPGRPWCQQRRAQAAIAAVVALLCPVRLTVLAPAELVPARPAVIRAPLDGVIDQFQVAPNDRVESGQALFNFDQAPINARLQVAKEALATVGAEYRQLSQMALNDAKSKTQLAVVLGKMQEKQAEADYLQSQLERSRVTAPQAGIALFDDPSEWVGKPVQTGERIMRVAAPGDVEVEVWLPLADAIPLQPQAPVTLYLAAHPLSSISAQVRYASHDAVVRPDGSYAYRLRAHIDSNDAARVGLKGTAKVYGGWVPLVYWVLRRPLAVVRQAVGL